MNIGIDIEEIVRFKLPKNHYFLKSTFTEKELKYAFARPKPQIHLCGFFCVKEAVRKTGTASKLLMKEIEVVHKKNGQPEVKINKRGNNWRFKVSISHSGMYAVGCAILEE